MDAVEAIIKVINSNSSTWKPVYNVSSDEILSLKEIAKHVVQIENEENGGMQANIEIENKPSDYQSGMERTQYKIEMKW